MDSEPTLQLDFRTFSYAGKFVMSNTGKAVIRRSAPIDSQPNADLPDGVDPELFEDDVLAAVAFNEDRTTPATLWLRYVTVHAGYRGRGLGPRLLGFVAERAERRGYDKCRIAVNNPFAYEAAYRSGFEYTGDCTGLAELVLERGVENHDVDRSSGRDRDRYRRGFEQFDRRELTDAERQFLERTLETPTPEPVGASLSGIDGLDSV